MNLTFDTRLEADPHAPVWATLSLDFDERQRSRALRLDVDGCQVRFALPRGLVLRGGDLVRAREDGRVARIAAKPEPVAVVRTEEPFALLRAAYHLGNRHVPVELQPDSLRLAPDPVLEDMVAHLGLDIVHEVVAFEPEAGAYQGHGHSHTHEHSHAH